jgi:glycosyltransferase involved in cell wall biosynthesis
MEKIKLSILTRFYPPDFAATGQLIEELANYLRSQKIVVEVFTGQPGYAFSTKSAPRIERATDFQLKRSRSSRIWPERILGKVFNGLIFFIRGAIHLLKSIWVYDLVMLTTEPPYLPILGYFIYRLTKFPYVCLLYDIYPDIVVKLGMLPSHNPLVKIWHWFNRKTWQHAQAIIVLSPSMRQQVLRHCPQAADKTFVIHSWCDPQEVQPIPKELNWFAQEHKLNQKFTVLYSGNMGRCHDMETILGAAKLLKDEPIQFVFIGGGSKMKALIEEMQAASLKNYTFLPYQEKKDLAYSLSAADLALVSLDAGMEDVIAPSKLYGLLAAGRPIAAICEKHSYLRDIISDAGCGASIDIGQSQQLADFIRYLSKSPQQVEVMGEAGRAYCLAHFTLKTTGQQYLDVFHSALGIAAVPDVAVTTSQ